MRLTSDEVAAIRECAAAHFGAGATVRLFGSRVRDDLRGGDIDLHIIAETAEQAAADRAWDFKEALELRIGEQRIDVILKAPMDALRPIDHIAIIKGIVL